MYFYDWAEAMEELAYVPRRIFGRIRGRLGNALGHCPLYAQRISRAHSHSVLDALICQN